MRLLAKFRICGVARVIWKPFRSGVPGREGALPAFGNRYTSSRASATRRHRVFEQPFSDSGIFEESACAHFEFRASRAGRPPATQVQVYPPAHLSGHGAVAARVLSPSTPSFNGFVFMRMFFIGHGRARSKSGFLVLART